MPHARGRAVRRHGAARVRLEDHPGRVAGRRPEADRRPASDERAAPEPLGRDAGEHRRSLAGLGPTIRRTVRLPEPRDRSRGRGAHALGAHRQHRRLRRRRAFRQPERTLARAPGRCAGWGRRDARASRLAPPPAAGLRDADRRRPWGAPAVAPRRVPRQVSRGLAERAGGRLLPHPPAGTPRRCRPRRGVGRPAPRLRVARGEGRGRDGVRPAARLPGGDRGVAAGGRPAADPRAS